VYNDNASGLTSRVITTWQPDLAREESIGRVKMFLFRQSGGLVVRNRSVGFDSLHWDAFPTIMKRFIATREMKINLKTWSVKFAKQSPSSFSISIREVMADSEFTLRNISTEQITYDHFDPESVR